jgi:hypothetical protein
MFGRLLNHEPDLFEPSHHGTTQLDDLTDRAVYLCGAGRVT